MLTLTFSKFCQALSVSKKPPPPPPRFWRPGLNTRCPTTSSLSPSLRGGWYEKCPSNTSIHSALSSFLCLFPRRLASIIARLVRLSFLFTPFGVARLSFRYGRFLCERIAVLAANVPCFAAQAVPLVRLRGLCAAGHVWVAEVEFGQENDAVFAIPKVGSERNHDLQLRQQPGIPAGGLKSSRCLLRSALLCIVCDRACNGMTVSHMYRQSKLCIHHARYTLMC